MAIPLSEFLLVSLFKFSVLYHVYTGCTIQTCIVIKNMYCYKQNKENKENIKNP